MRIDIRAGEQVTIGRSRDGKILIVQRESGTTLVTTNDEFVELEISHSRHWGLCPIGQSFDYGSFWEQQQSYWRGAIHP